MAEGSNTGPRRHGRASWVALRTLRQVPKVIGETGAGEPIVEIRSVRLVLRAGAHHFSRVTTCSKCGREVPGAPVLGPGDLDHPPHPVICKDCVRTASAPVLTAERRPVGPDRQPGPSREGTSEADDHVRMAALERQVAELAELVKGQRADLEAALEGRVEETRVEVRSFATKELARAQEDVDRMMKGVVERAGRAAVGDAGGAQAVEARLTRSIERLTQRVDDQRAELVADLEGRLAQLEDRTGPAGAQMEAPRTQPAATDGDRARLEAVETQLRELQAGVEAQAARVEAQLTTWREGLAVQVAPDRQRLDGVEARLGELQARFERETVQGQERLVGGAEQAEPDRRRLEALEARLGELQAELEAGTARIEAQVAERLDRLAQEATPHGARLDGLEAGLRRLEATTEEAKDAAARADEQLARVEAALDEQLDRQAERVTGSPAAGDRLDDLEEQLDDAVGRLALLVESQRLELQEDFGKGLAELRAMVAALESANATRLEKLEAASTERTAQLAELVELQTTLDTGLGELRSEIEQVRETATQASDINRGQQPQVEVPQFPLVEAERGRRGGKRSADAVASLSAAVQGLLTEHRQLRGRISTLENESETAVRASARASAQATAVAPLRQDVRALREELLAQNEAVAGLTSTVENLRRTIPPTAAAKPATKSTAAGPAPAATKATKTTKATAAKKATKATKTIKATKVTKATGATTATRATKKQV